MLLVNYMCCLTKHLERDSWQKGQTKEIGEMHHNFWKEGLRVNFENLSLPLTF